MKQLIRKWLGIDVIENEMVRLGKWTAIEDSMRPPFLHLRLQDLETAAGIGVVLPTKPVRAPRKTAKAAKG